MTQGEGPATAQAPGAVPDVGIASAPAAPQGGASPEPSLAESDAASESPAPEAFAWQIAPDQTLALAAGTTTTVATGAVGMTASVSPALPAGRTLAVTASGQVVIAAAPDAPAVDAVGPWLVEVRN